jgi:hypothetical protein
MSDERAKRGLIKPPVNNHPDDKVRALVEAGVGVIPGGGSVTRLVADLLPTQAQKARSEWEITISDRTNENTDLLEQHAQLLTPTSTVTGVAAQLVTALAQESGDGMRGKRRMLDDLCKLLPSVERKAIEDAAFELSSHGVVDIERAIGKHWWLYLSQNFYEQFDHQVMGWSTADDAAVLAQLMLDHEQMQRTAALHDATGWNRRRFNPAFQLLLGLITTGWISEERQPDYPAPFVGPLPEDQARFRRFILERTRKRN